jgi:hypothetical protein
VNRAARLALLYFTAFPWQRRLAVTGFATSAVGVGLMVASRSGSVVALVGLACILVPTATTSGFVLRAFSSPRSQQLVPGFRRNMAAAIALVVAAQAVGAAFGWWLLSEAPAVTALTEGLTVGALLASTLLIWTFAMSGPPLQTLLLLIATYGVGTWVTQVGTEWLPVSTPVAASVACAVLWLLFGTWYRRTRPIAPVGIYQSLSLPPALGGYQPTQSTTQSAALYLGDRLPWPLYRGLAVLTVLAAAAAAVVWVLDRLDRRIEIPLSTLLNLPLIVTFLGLPRVYRLVTHSRALWLRTPGLRAGVFRVCEAEALRGVAWNVVFAGLLVGGFILARPSLTWDMLPLAVLLYLATGLLLAYLGLMLVHGLRVIDLTAGLLLAAFSFVALQPLAAEPTEPLPVAAIVALEVLTALTLRSIAARRWSGIDWLELRAPRTRSQAVRMT